MIHRFRVSSAAMSKSPASPPIAIAILIVLLLAGSIAELCRLGARRDVLQERTRINLHEARAAAQALARVKEQGDAVRDLVLATTPVEIRDAEGRFSAVGRRHDDAQAALLSTFAADPATTAEERALLATVTNEQRATVGPVLRVVKLARRNEDEAATRILVEQALPHEAALQASLAELGALHARDSQALARGLDMQSLEMGLTVGLGALAALLGALLLCMAPRWTGARTAPMRQSRRPMPRLSVSAQERARALVATPGVAAVRADNAAVP